MKNKTALQQFIDWGNQMIGDYSANKLSFYEAIDKAEELLEVEKQQIMKANRDGVDMVIDQKPFVLGEAYYNKTYGRKSN